MKKTAALVLSLFALLSLISCSSENAIMNGFTYFELSEYLSSIDGLSQVPDGYAVQCGNREILIDTDFPDSGPVSSQTGNDGSVNRNSFDLYYLLSYRVYREINEETGYYQYFSVFSTLTKTDSYLGAAPNNFAYMIEEYGLNSSPQWTEWIQYGIPAHTRDHLNGIIDYPKLSQGKFSRYIYDSNANEYKEGIYIRDREDSTEVYVVYQEISLFFRYGSGWLPYFASEEMIEKLQNDLKSDFTSELYKKVSAPEAIKWFLGEYTEKPPASLENIKEDLYIPCFPTEGNTSLQTQEIHSLQKTDIPVYMRYMEETGVDPESIRAFVIKITIPHDGTMNDITWELIG